MCICLYTIKYIYKYVAVEFKRGEYVGYTYIHTRRDLRRILLQTQTHCRFLFIKWSHTK